MFVFSRIAFFLLRPSTLIVVLLVVGVVVLISGRAPRVARTITVTALSLMLAIGYLPIGSAFLLPLENRFAVRTIDQAPVQDIAGIIILGGFETVDVTARRGVLALNESAERLTTGIRLAKRLPTADVIFTGGVAELWGDTPSAAKPVGAYLADLGIARDRIKLEAASRNTFENARMTYELIKPAPEGRYLLVTSAYHMPRAVGVFRAAGFQIDAWPVDYRVADADALWDMNDSLPAGLARFDVACREWLGLAAYFALGRTPSVFPAP